MNLKNKRVYEYDEYSNENSSPYLNFFRKTEVYNQIIVPIDEDIKEPSYYRNIVLTLTDLQEGDEVNFYINSPGGDLSGLVSLLSVIKHTKAHTVATILGAASSSASILALHCDEVVLTEYSTMLVHSGSYYGLGGKSSDVADYLQHLERVSKDILESTYKGFLTDTEIKDVLQGKEMWLDAKAIYARLKAREKYLDKGIKSIKSVRTTSRKKVKTENLEQKEISSSPTSE